ncbi:MAG: hypothetical protein M3Z06_14740 [Actinomycetota bacterium]|nr:hypothetical protein [Actinomycetota bacterium]
MAYAIFRRSAAMTFAGLCTLALAATASAATTPTTTANRFGCRASLVRVQLLSLPAVEPIVANKRTAPCITETQGLNQASAPSVKTGLVLAGPAGVFTHSSTSQPTTAGPVAPGAAALATIDGVTLPTTKGAIIIAGPVQASASYACINGTVQAAAQSTLNVITVAGQHYTVPSSRSTTISLGGGSYITVNEKHQTATSITERVLDVHVKGLADVILGEAQVTQMGANPCAGTTNDVPPSLNTCPAGSTLNVAAQVCEIILDNGTVIVISRPFDGPTGGTVLALSVARKRYHSKCLNSPGPKYAIVGTNRPDRINGTHRPERILGLGGNDRIAGRGGNDCLDGGTGNDDIADGKGNDREYGGNGSDRLSVQSGNAFADGGAGNDRIFLGNGNDRAYGDAGNDRISVGRGTDRVWGGTGNDDLTSADGNDMIDGGSGNDRIWVGNGKNHVFGRAGNDRIFAPGLVVYVSCGTGVNLAFTDALSRGYARRHGCQTVRTLKPRKP